MSASPSRQNDNPRAALLFDVRSGAMIRVNERPFAVSRVDSVGSPSSAKQAAAVLHGKSVCRPPTTCDPKAHIHALKERTAVAV